MDEKSVIERFRPIISIKIKKEIGFTNPDWEDLTNEVLIIVLQALRKDKSKHKSSIGTYIYGITKNVLGKYKYERIKEKKKKQKSEYYSTYREDIEIDYEKKESLDLITAKIRKLDFKYRQILYLYYYQSLSRETIARILNLSLNQVDTRINYALKLLKKELNL